MAFAEKKSLIAFAGKKVIEATINEELPDNFQTAEYVQECGFVDSIVERKNLKEKITSLLLILLNKNSELNSENSNETSEPDIETAAKAS